MSHPPRDMRRSYTLHQLDEADLAADPITQFRRWFDDAVAANQGAWFEPNAMTLATVDADGPTTRTVLMKEIEPTALVFYTNHHSRKGRAIAANPQVAATFHWPRLERQVNLTGLASQVSRAQAEAYFRTRPRENQLGALVSHQSRVIPGRDQLARRLAALEASLAGRDVPLPDHWGGYRITIDTIEFWQGGAGRLHDRLRYRRPSTREPWIIERLSP